MVRNRGIVAAFVAAMVLALPGKVWAGQGEATKAEIDALKKDVEELRKKLASQSTAMPRSAVDKAVEAKGYGPNAAVTTRSGKLTVGGLIQVWYYSIQNDNRGLFDDANGTGIIDTNEASDNDSFRIRRAELNFNIDIHENVTGYVMIDAAGEASSFPNFAGGQATGNGVGFRTANLVAPEFDGANGPGLGNVGTVASVQQGSGAVPTLLQDALINYHGVVPHHDFTIGQYLPMFSEEDFRPNGHIDFVERSFIGLRFTRDLGVTVHGSWWDDDDSTAGPYAGAGAKGRLQYWLSVFNGAGSYHTGNGRNRSDDNDEKDFLGTIMIRPLWMNETWGSIELGWSSGVGIHGESSSDDPINGPINGLNRDTISAIRHSGWASYRPGGPVRGWWLIGEWQYVKDRMPPGSVVDLTGSGGTDIGNTGSGSGFAQSNGGPFHTQGWYFGTGYNISKSAFCDSAPGWLKPWEFVFRYQSSENVAVADLNNPAHTDVFKTQVWTGGINYYIKGHNAKIQANYNFVDDPDGKNPARGFRNVRNDSFVVQFQVEF